MATYYAFSNLLSRESLPWPALLFALGIPAGRFVLDHTLFQAIGASLVLPKYKKTDAVATEADTVTLVKFKESFFKLVVYLSLTLWEIGVSYNESFLTDTRYYWLGCTKLPCDMNVSKGLWLLYCAQMGYYMQGIPALIFWEHRRKDFWEQMGHHIATLSLIIYSFHLGLLKVGCMVFLVHDMNDIFMEAAKMARYSGRPRLCTSLFVTFMLTWFGSRIYYFPVYIIRSTLTEPIKLVAEVYNINPQPHYTILNGMLLFLLGLHLYWSFLILRIAYKQVKEGETSDVREDD